MSDFQNKIFVCSHCGMENSVEDTLAKAEYERARADIEAKLRAEYSEDMASLQRKVEAREIEANSLKEINAEQIQSQIELALAKQKSELQGKHLLDKELLKNENESLKRNIEELGQRSNQGSVQAQGEAGETFIEDVLHKNFPYDSVKEIGKGHRGADCLLTVSAGQVCNSILIESKVTKNWDNKWLPKLRTDMERENAVFGVLVSDALPSTKSSAFNDGNIWICGFHEFTPITIALRQGLDQLNRFKLARGAAENTAQEALDFLTSPRFVSNMEGMLAPLVQLREQLSAEKRAFDKQWRIRENNINKMFNSAALLHGDLISIAGENIPEISMLPSVHNILPEEK